MRNPFRKPEDDVRSGGTRPIQITVKDTTEYKLSEINDSGVYLPPSPPERKSFWPSSVRSTKPNSTRRTQLDDKEQFSISRESFDSYRRSFDISARSPVIHSAEAKPRISLDSRPSMLPPSRNGNGSTSSSTVPTRTTEESVDAFEEVDIGEKPAAQPKKKGLFGRIAESGERTENRSPWHLPGRRRGQSGQGAELKTIPTRDITPTLESQLRKENMKPVAAEPHSNNFTTSTLPGQNSQAP
ncbi:hypothetical protein K470DRAFT_272838 [Piedraia hortae CBS 480.64]|uniref:Uncharacterized protein n=1 Tax=Piedraia hortae CBS 480.64 TaxID=1314780 RepID=A0A6A7BRZ1_9PEZI|nr:hypothetical protein K470DRAFT_272838 [Piedraia hortae CBS 480.64]